MVYLLGTTVIHFIQFIRSVFSCLRIKVDIRHTFHRFEYLRFLSYD